MLLMLDAAFPPAPGQWVTDMHAVGAQIGAVYVWGPYVNYTRAHVDAARAAGLGVLPIIVPGNSPPPPPLYAAAWPYGITGGPLAYDIESGSLPGTFWVNQAVQDSNAAGWNAGVYAQGSVRPLYPAGWWWLARWPYAPGVWQPVPTDLGASVTAWQFAHDVMINGSQYDISIVDPALFPALGGSDMTPEEHQLLVGLDIEVGANYAPNGIAGVLLNGTSVWQQATDVRLGALTAKVDTLTAKVDALSTPVVDVPALAAALATHPLTAQLSDAERDAIASHVALRFGRDLAAG